MYRDSEMAIWLASGLGLPELAASPFLRFAWPIVASECLSWPVAWPWSNQQIQQCAHNSSNAAIYDRIAPGEFQESSDGTA